MPIVAKRITSTGTLFISGEFDEITKDVISLTTETYYANFFDEVDLFGTGIAMRETTDGTVLISNGLNEVEKPV